jgi:hypothetical protein
MAMAMCALLLLTEWQTNKIGMMNAPGSEKE